MKPRDRPKRFEDEGEPGAWFCEDESEGEESGTAEAEGERVKEGRDEVPEGGVPAGLPLDEDEVEVLAWMWRGRMSTAVGGATMTGVSVLDRAQIKRFTGCSCSTGAGGSEEGVRGSRRTGAGQTSRRGGASGDCKVSGAIWRV